MLSLFKRLFGGARKAHDRQRPNFRGAAARKVISASADSKTSLVDALDNPDLTIEPPPETGFDPYNTGTFNRSGSWERINKRRDG